MKAASKGILAALFSSACVALLCLPAGAQNVDGLTLVRDNDRTPGIGGSSAHTYRRGDGRRGCNPDRALDRAYAMGMRNARIGNVSPRSISVIGRDRRGKAVTLVFGRDFGCPLVRR
jgi:hypothetical protein